MCLLIPVLGIKFHQPYSTTQREGSPIFLSHACAILLRCRSHVKFTSIYIKKSYISYVIIQQSNLVGIHLSSREYSTVRGNKAYPWTKLGIKEQGNSFFTVLSKKTDWLDYVPRHFGSLRLMVLLDIVFSFLYWMALLRVQHGSWLNSFIKMQNPGVELFCSCIILLRCKWSIKWRWYRIFICKCMRCIRYWFVIYMCT